MVINIVMTVYAISPEEVSIMLATGEVSPEELEVSLLEAVPESRLRELVQRWDENRPVVLVVAGKKGIGKSTLINNLLGLKGDRAAKAAPGARPTTLETCIYEENINGVPLKIIDTPGLGSARQAKEKLEKTMAELTTLTDKKADLFLYCASMNQGCQIDDTDIGILKSFRMVFGKILFRHCILVNTFANQVIAADPGNREGTVNEAVHDYATDFCDALKEAGIPNIPVQPIHLVTDTFEGILSIPAGNKDDRVPFPLEWEKKLLNEILKKCDPEVVLPLLKIKGLKKATVLKYLGITYLQDAIGMPDGAQTKRATLKIAVRKELAS